MTDHAQFFFSSSSQPMPIFEGFKHAICIWFTGLSGAGKSTLANALQQRITSSGKQVIVLDGDLMRQGLCSDLDMSLRGRSENLRRLAEVSKLMLNAGVIVITASISPMLADRSRAKDLIGKERFFEVYVSTSLQCCESRDPKGLYKLARCGVIKDFTGIDSPFEPPEENALWLNTESLNVEESVESIIKYCFGEHTSLMVSSNSYDESS